MTVLVEASTDPADPCAVLAPVSGAIAFIYNRDEVPICGGMTDAEGRFECQMPLPPGFQGGAYARDSLDPNRSNTARLQVVDQGGGRMCVTVVLP